MPDDGTRPPAAMSALDTELHAWRETHPDATLTEIEQAVDARLRAVRAALLAEVIGADEAEPRCPDCGGRLVRRGRRSRTLVTQGDETVELLRTYATCPVCGTGLFPP